MNLNNLAYFIVAAEELNFTRAARRLYISQQALSNHIAKLEEYYQVPLFDRGIPMTLTDAGKVLYESARQVVDTMGVCDRRLQDIKDFTRGNLSVGIPVTRGTIMLPPLCSAFLQMYPNIHLDIMEGRSTAEVEQALFEGQIDLAIGYLPENSANIISESLFVEEYVLAAQNHLLDSQFSRKKLEEMKGRPQPLSVFSGLPFVAQTENTMGGRVFRQLCEEADIKPHVVLKTQNILTQINLCIAGLGICTIPSTFVKESGSVAGLRGAGIFGQESRSRITVFRLTSATGSAPLVVNRLRSKLLTHAGREFVKLAKELFGE